MALARAIPIIDLSFIDHPEGKATLVIYFCGCPHKCKGCHSKDLQDAHYYKCEEIDVPSVINKIDRIFEHAEDIIRGIVFLGGEPLLYSKFLEELCSELQEKYPHLDLVLYTGFVFEIISSQLKKYLTYVIDGKFEIDKKTDGFPASLNQIIWFNDKGIWKDVTNKLKTY